MKNYDQRLLKYYEGYYKHSLTLRLLENLLELFNFNRDPLMYRASLVHELGHVDEAIDNDATVTILKVKRYVVLISKDSYTIQTINGAKANGSIVFCYFEKTDDLNKYLIKTFSGGIHASNQLKYIRQWNPIHAYNLLIYRFVNQRWNRKRGSDGYYIKMLDKMNDNYAQDLNKKLKTEAIDEFMKYSLMGLSI